MRFTSTTTPRRAKMGLLLPMLIFVGLLVALYVIKAQTLSARAQVDSLEQALLHEKQVVQMLSAEIAHLESPERLRALAAEQLELQPTPVKRTLTLEQAAQALAKGGAQ